MTIYLHFLINKPFKDHLKHLYSEWILAEDHVETNWNSEEAQDGTGMPLDQGTGNETLQK
ncbi:hypothetical protein B7P43_G03046 [Cryptotermes secundus]|uniref:Uncharacterized protein n=1 Tax=Cryptotermes secundus TaxID=105785 RepID=A0A2J7Q4X6_9NEOP|nr:hypothetical protein B7P43_G03046 [Cryptotermes secundus]